jgi:hypothetical protein
MLSQLRTPSQERRGYKTKAMAIGVETMAAETVGKTVETGARPVRGVGYRRCGTGYRHLPRRGGVDKHLGRREAALTRALASGVSGLTAANRPRRADGASEIRPDVTYHTVGVTTRRRGNPRYHTGGYDDASRNAQIPLGASIHDTTRRDRQSVRIIGLPTHATNAPNRQASHRSTTHQHVSGPAIGGAQTGRAPVWMVGGYAKTSLRVTVCRLRLWMMSISCG